MKYKVSFCRENTLKDRFLAHDASGGQKEKYLQLYKRYADEVTANTPGAVILNILLGNNLMYI
jgi:hypothetical protein